MRFFLVRNEQQCSFCGSSLSWGEEATLTRIKRQNGSFDLKLGHIECFRKWSDDEFVRRYLDWKDTITRRPLKRKYKKKKITGRPRLFSHPVVAARLRGLIHYYRKQGNTDKVDSLQAELNSMKVGTGGH